MCAHHQQISVFFYWGNIERTRAFILFLCYVGTSTGGAFCPKCFTFSKLVTCWCWIVISSTVFFYFMWYQHRSTDTRLFQFKLLAYTDQSFNEFVVSPASSSGCCRLQVLWVVGACRNLFSLKLLFGSVLNRLEPLVKGAECPEVLLPTDSSVSSSPITARVGSCSLASPWMSVDGLQPGIIPIKFVLFVKLPFISI